MKKNKTSSHSGSKSHRSKRSFQQRRAHGDRKPAGMLEGEITMHRDGYGFVIPDDPKSPDVFIPPHRLQGAMHLDRVRVKVFKDRSNRLEGEVQAILKRGSENVVGEFRIYGEHAYVEARLPGKELLVLIPKSAQGRAKDGHVVLAKLTEYGAHPKGMIVRVLGGAGEKAVEIESIIAKFGLAVEFTQDAKTEAKDLERVGVEIDDARVDLRNLPIVTIDGENARDFDDAICVRREGEHFRIWVSIADVCHYVQTGTALDREAYQRGTSAYFPHFCIPMLPEELSNDLCSLVPKEDRLTFTAEMTLSHHGEVLSKKIYKSVIRSQARLTYTWVNQAIVMNDHEAQASFHHVVPMLQEAVELAKLLRGVRKKRGSIDFDLPEPQFVLGEENETLDIVRTSRNFAHMMIEEFMILANETVAQYAQSHQLPFVYRIHEEPDPEKVYVLSELLHNLGVGYNLKAGAKPKDFSRVTEIIQGRPEERLINHVMLRTMKQAVYSEENVGHFGLASSCYTHFTSPIRRYPDLLIHRILSEFLKKPGKKRRVLYGKNKLHEMATHCSKRERNAMESEWEVQALQVALFMQDKVGNIYTGHIARVARFGLFVELDEFFVEGLLHVEDLEDDYYEYDATHHRMVGSKHKRVFKIGDPVTVMVKEVSIPERQVRLSLSIENQ